MYTRFLVVHAVLMGQFFKWNGTKGRREISQRRNGLVLAPVAPPPVTDPPAPETPPTPDGPPKTSAGCVTPAVPISMEFPAGPMGEIPLKGIAIGLDCTIPMLMPGAAIGTPIPGMLIPGWIIPIVGIWLSMGLGGTGLVRSWLRPSEDGWGEIEGIGLTPKGFEDEAGVGDTPRLEMVLPGVTATPGAGEGPKEKTDRKR